MSQVPPKPSVKTVSDLHAEIRKLNSQIQQMKPMHITGSDYVRSVQGENPRTKWNDAVMEDKRAQRDAGMKRAAELLEEQGDTYPHDGIGTRKLAEHAGLSNIEDARAVFSAHLKRNDERRWRQEDAERTHLLGRAKQLAPQFVRTAVRSGIEVASRKLAERAGVSLGISQQALEECADEMNGQHQQ
jgi:hypothetical protein